MTTAKKETLLEAAARRGLYYSPDEHKGMEPERAPPGDDTMEEAWGIIGESISYLGTSEGGKLATRIARALGQRKPG